MRPRPRRKSTPRTSGAPRAGRPARGAATANRLARGDGVRVLLVTVPDEARGREIARALVEERLAACGNVVPIAASIYRWEGQVVEESEFLLVLKTTAARAPVAADRVLALHPYRVPEILVLPVAAGLDAYLRWVADETRG
jgi:periplasmic divalent cation tolerance protein